MLFNVAVAADANEEAAKSPQGNAMGGDTDAEAFFEAAAERRAAKEETSRREESGVSNQARAEAVRAELVERMKASWTRLSVRGTSTLQPPPTLQAHPDTLQRRTSSARGTATATAR